MVKGITRQVILVKSPDPRLFEEAIFIVKEEALAREGGHRRAGLKGGPPGGGRLPEAGPGLEPAAGAAARPPVGRVGGSSRQRRVAGVAVPAVRDLNHF